MNIVRELDVEGAAARALLLNLRSIFADDDDDLIHDTVEGETDLLETINSALLRLQELDAHAEAIKTQMDNLKDRASRFKNQGETIRAAIANAMCMAELRKIELPTGTVSLRAVAPSLVVTEEADIPSEFFEPQPPKLDKRALLAALKDKREVPGATLSNGLETLSIRSR